LTIKWETISILTATNAKYFSFSKQFRIKLTLQAINSPTKKIRLTNRAKINAKNKYLDPMRTANYFKGSKVYINLYIHQKDLMDKLGLFLKGE